MFDLIKAVFKKKSTNQHSGEITQLAQSVTHWRTLYFDMAVQYDELEEQTDLYKQRMYAQTNKLKAERKKTGRLLYLLDALIEQWNQEEHPSSPDMYLCMANLVDTLEQFSCSKRFVPEPLDFDDNCGKLCDTLRDNGQDGD